MLNLKFLLFIGLSVSPLINAKSVEVPDARESRIFKGVYDVTNEHRYHVAILKLSDDGTTEHVCGGAIIESRYVMTAAHCVYGLEKTQLQIRSGWNKEPKDPAQEKRSYHKVTKIVYPKDYNPSPCRHHQHDIAILKVMRNFDLADDINYKKISLPEIDNDFEFDDATFTGYGVEKIRLHINKTANTVEKKFKYPEELKYLDTQVLPLEQCKKVSSVIVTNENVCTVPKNSHGFSCIGDSGGPLVHDGVIIGIRNSHNNECIHDEPELFTRVSSYLEFINNVLNNEFSSDIMYL